MGISSSDSILPSDSDHMKRIIGPAILLFLIPGITLMAQETDTSKLKSEYFEVNEFVEENEACFQCHGELKYTLEDTLFGRTVTKPMYPELIINRDAYYENVHKSFMCLDCHAYGYEEFPHPLEAKLEEHYACIDCHGYDEAFAEYQFEAIQVQFEESIHNIDEFTCWKCHDPHTYQLSNRTDEKLGEAIRYNNSMCLGCHGDYNNFMLLSDRQEVNILEEHDWLPNQLAHFQSVRCIECHTEINDTVLVAHKILPRDQAVERCTECHSRDSRLMHSLYKFQVQEDRKAGFVNGVIINDTFVIGATRHLLLDRISLVVFVLALLVILFHTILRIRKSKAKSS